MTRFCRANSGQRGFSFGFELHGFLVPFLLSVLFVFPSVDTSSVSTVPVSGQRSSRAQEDESTVDWTWEEVTPRETLSQVETTSDKYRNFSYVSFEVCYMTKTKT